MAIPGLLQAENFDDGGEGIAYHDATPGNAGGQYRSASVDIESASDLEGGYNIVWIVAGEWLKYTVSMSLAASYTLEFRLAAPGTGGVLHLEVNGTDVTGPGGRPTVGS